MKSLTKQTDSMVRPTAPTVVSPVVPAAAFVPRPIKKRNKKGHIVQFVDEAGKPGDLLENVRVFHQEEFEFEAVPWQNDTHGASTHQLEAAEGSAMKVHEHLEEEVDWVEPSGELCSWSIPELVLIAEYTGIPPIIDPTPECLEQEARERGILASSFETSTSPDETGVRVIQKGPTTGSWYQPIMASPAPAQTTSVSALLGALNPAIFGVAPAAAPAPAPVYGYGQYGQPSYDYAQPVPPHNSWGAPTYGAPTNEYASHNNGWGQNVGYGGQNVGNGGQQHQYQNSGYGQHDNGYRGRGRGWGQRWSESKACNKSTI
jgi:hypothetical protein